MNKPVVAIVGRPNVGKSTLFNRIIGKRHAIVDDQPGVTRDRNYSEAEWTGHEFVVIDTGGFVPKAGDIIEEKVTEQAENALIEADVIIFLTDVTTGITDIDDEVANQLRKSNKPCLLVVNKVDNDAREIEASEFLRLGLGEPVSISALIGRGIGDLLSLLVQHIEKIELSPVDDEDEYIKLAVVGRPNVGKSTFINTILGEDRHVVTDQPGTTRDAIDTSAEIFDRKFILVDTAGLRRKARVKDSVEFYSNIRTQNALKRCDVACLFTESEGGITSQDLHILKSIIEYKKGAVVVVNKWDLVKNDKEKSNEVMDTFIRLRGFEFVPLLRASCKTGFKTKQIMKTVIQVADERKKRVDAPSLNKMLEELNRYYQHPAVKGKRIRVLYGTQTETDPPRFVFFSNHPQLISDNYYRFLENQIRSRFGFRGVPVSIIFRKK
ncbi:ribosome biogenesis GTPase Der [candidate division KSB1 bacterium]|nr:MAG: ribosome biogenesis GTPase Der [candidate division KSB1 bacterium]